MQAYKINVLSPALKSKVERIISKSSATPEESLQWAFVENKAVFHKKCLIKYDEGHLKRLLEKESPEHETVSPKKTRRSFSATNFLDNCFFCNSEEGILFKCATTSLSKHVNVWATYLKDSKLLAKLSEGDMHAIEAKYHKKCLTETYNKF